MPPSSSWGNAVISWERIARRIRVPLGFLFALIYVWLSHPTVVSILASSVLVVLGLIVRALASGYVRKNEELTTDGPYAYTRNPLYLGSMILALGFAIAGRSIWIAVCLAVFFLLIYIPVIRAEEAHLREHFPEFDNYARQVPRLLPRLRAARSKTGNFSWELYRKHREHNATLGSLAMLAILLTKMLWVRNK
jgi:protein-S-isoprenylcysteine O-methyltransferase Ste14